MKTLLCPDKKNTGGRPPKFDEPSRPITLTLPESTLRELSLIDADRGQAIVKLARAALRRDQSPRSLVEVVEMAENTGLLIVGPSDKLKQIPFLHLVEVAPARFLLALESGNDYRALEIAVRDVLDEISEGEEFERNLLGQLLENIMKLRKSERVTMAEILLVSLDNGQRN